MGGGAFGQVLESADKLSLDDQETLVGILHRRLIERRREELAQDIEDADREFLDGSCRPARPAELMKEALSTPPRHLFPRSI